MDRLQSILLVAGLGCFVFAFVMSGLYPYLITDARAEEADFAELARNVSPDFKNLKDRWPVAFGRAVPRADEALTLRELRDIPPGDPRRQTSEDAWREAYAFALREGRDIYIAEGCWHCHSQYVRPVANEEVRFGRIRTPKDDNNRLQRPVLWGTRRVGPDLTNEGGRHSNDWHVAHFADPTSTTPGSVMPPFTWYFREGWQVRRHADPQVIRRRGLPEDRSYAYPGIYDTEEEAVAAMEKLQQTIDPDLEAEKDRMFVAECRGPDAKLLQLIAYIQWLGTWRPELTRETDG